MLKFKLLPNVNNPKSIHGIYPYRGKISAVDAEQIIKQLPNKGTLLDPFCGSGTILYEGRKHGLRTIGVDANPIALQISKAKLSQIDVDKSISKIDMLLSEPDIDSSEEMPYEALKYFHHDTAKQIMSLMKHYDSFSDYEKAVFLGSICLAARGCNLYKWSSTQIGKIAEKKKRIDFYEKFRMKLLKHAHPIEANNSKVIQGDTRQLSNYIKPKSVDIVYTSPPYFDGLDYTSNYTRIVHHVFGNNVQELKQSFIQNFDCYESDIKKCFEEIIKVTSDDALIIFVVGDKKKGKLTINGGDFFTQIIDKKPEMIVEREYSGTASKIWDKINKTKRKEQIIVWNKSKW